jgi:hypothetical protein
MIALDRLQQIIPADQALANKALATALQQIGGISNLNLPVLAQTIDRLETTKDLPAVTALSVAVPAAVANYYLNTLGQGTGTNNNILITDILGTAGGFVMQPALANTVATLDTMDLSYLTEIYDTMLDVVNGVYTGPDITDPMQFATVIPLGLPAAGTYGPAATANETIDLAISSGLIPAAQTEIGNVIATYPAQISSMNTDWTAMANQLVEEQTSQASANLVFADLTANQRNSIYGFIFSLPGYALDIKQGGMTQFLEAVADITTFTGQSIVACLRQGRNQQVLNSAGIIVSSKIPSEPIPPPPDAVLIPSEYTESEAASLVIK